jgi:hypothetical protein
MATQKPQGSAALVQYEISVHWSDQRPAVVARLDQAQARELVERLAVLAPREVDLVGLGSGADPVALLMGLQAFYRLTVQRDGCLALADIDGGLWTIPARSVQSVRVRAIEGPVTSPPLPDVIRIDRRAGGGSPSGAGGPS